MPANESTEVWIAIPGHDNYEASSFGRIRRSKPGSGARAGRVLKPCVGNSGYEMVHLHSGAGRLGTAVSVHLAVYRSHAGEILDGMEINHIDGVKTNNRASNLAAVTRSENIKHAYATGLIAKPRGESSTSAKLTTAAVVDILSGDFRRGYATQMARKYGVSCGAVCEIINGRNWKHVPRSRPPIVPVR